MLAKVPTYNYICNFSGSMFSSLTKKGDKHFNKCTGLAVKST